MNNDNNTHLNRGAIYYYNYGDNPGSIQCGRRPVLVIQADEYNKHSSTVVVAAITSVIKKQYLPSHIILPVDCGLPSTSMVMLEQIKTVNKDELVDYIGCISDEETWRRINNGMKKLMGLWVYKVERSGQIMTLCPHCRDDYTYVPGTVLHRLDPFQAVREPCTLCSRPGYDYVIFDKRKSTSSQHIVNEAKDDKG